jgi:K+-transporting ATPase KdpF subunit
MGINLKPSIDKEVKMDIFYWSGGVMAAVLLIYLIVVLLKPEIFS